VLPVFSLSFTVHGRTEKRDCTWTSFESERVNAKRKKMIITKRKFARFDIKVF